MVEVSVITATYNAATKLERNIRSVAAQSLQALEHIIVDDGSTDETAELIGQMRREFPHLRAIRQANRGAGSARNAGIEAARGRFIAFLDSDDYWTQCKLEAQIGFMTKLGVAFSYGDYGTLDARTDRWLGHHEAPSSLTYRDLLRGCPIGCLTAAFDQEALGKHYMPHVRRGQDWGLWLKLARLGEGARRYPGCHAIYMRSRGSLSSKKLRKAADIYRIYREQEGLGRVRSAGYLLPHAMGALTKQYHAAQPVDPMAT